MLKFDEEVNEKVDANLSLVKHEVKYHPRAPTQQVEEPYVIQIMYLHLTKRQ